mmetsp:Transcript_957/g.1189  ORF Transcript_957/g.1189 Transcript_957/m.1189 type:complete len:334 (-) Transcript_957:295-1296(-)
MKFQGLCTFPHGYISTLSLLAGTASGLGATVYAFAACRFVFVSFTSRWGNINEVLDIETDAGGNEYRDFRVSGGLYSWLTSEDAKRFEPGSCTAFTPDMMESLSDPYFDVIRIIAVAAVLLSFMMIVWLFLLLTLSMGKVEIFFMKLCYVTLTALIGSTFLVFKTNLCNDVGESTECTLDEGGLVAIAGSILWFVCFLITCFFISPPGEDLILIDGELRSVYEDRQIERKRQAEIRKMQREVRREESKMEKEQRRQEKEVRLSEDEEVFRKSKKSNSNVETPEKEKQGNELLTPETFVQSVDENGDDGMEVFLSTACNSIEDIMNCGGKNDMK